MKSTPVLFKPEMIRACLDGRKRMTRRLVKPQPAPDATSMPEQFPYGRVGDEIWAKETWTVWLDQVLNATMVKYAADGKTHAFTDEQIPTEWRVPVAAGSGNVSPLYMPRWASRFVRTLTRVRVEKLQSITEVDTELEGVTLNTNERELATEAFARLWDSINRDRAPWASNPWVWVLEW